MFVHCQSSPKRLVTSLFTIVELASASDRLAKQRILSRTLQKELLRTFAADAEEHLHFISMDDGIVLSAANFVTKFFLRPGDALQLASLERAKESVSGYELDVTFIASDNALCEAASSEGVTAVSPQTVTSEEWREFLG